MADGEGDDGFQVLGEFEDFVEGSGVKALHRTGIDAHFGTSSDSEAEGDIGLAFGPGFYPTGFAVVGEADHHIFVRLKLLTDFRFSSAHLLHEVLDAAGEVGAG